ncbi:hypothetical protein ACMFMF_010892 [Clarireedia jacksonii]
MTTTRVTTFPYFPHLPPEIRYKVWLLNLPSPRLVPIIYTPLTPLPPFPLLLPYGCTSPAPIPANLHTNREARHHASRFYTLTFNLLNCEPKVYFNMNTDVLYFGNQAPAAGNDSLAGAFKNFTHVMDMVEYGQLERIRRLAVHEGVLGSRVGIGKGGEVFMDMFWEVVRGKLAGLEEVIFVVESGETGDGEGGFEGGRRELSRVEELGFRVLEAQEGVKRRMGNGEVWRAPAWRVLEIEEEEKWERLSGGMGC